MLNSYNLENQHIFCKRHGPEGHILYEQYKYISMQTRLHYPMTLRRQERCLLTLPNAFCSFNALSVCSQTLKSKIHGMFFLTPEVQSSKILYNILRNPRHIWMRSRSDAAGGRFLRHIIQQRTNNPWQPGGKAIHHLPCPLLIWGGNNLIGCLCESVRTKVALTPLNPASGDRGFTALYYLH